jgi:hypothetical protein
MLAREARGFFGRKFGRDLASGSGGVAAELLQRTLQ